MERDLEATAEAPRASPAMRMSSKHEDIDGYFKPEAAVSQEASQYEGIRRRNTDQAIDAVRDTNVSSTDTERTLTDDLDSWRWNIKGTYWTKETFIVTEATLTMRLLKLTLLLGGARE